MATVTFRLKGTRVPSPIYLQFRHENSHNIWIKSGKVIDPKNWNSNKKTPFLRTPELKNLAKDLRDLGNYLTDSFNDANSKQIDRNWFQKQIDIFNGHYVDEEQQSDLLEDCIQHIIETANVRENSKGGLGLSRSRINSYSNLLKIIKAFQGRKKYRVQDVDINFGKTFLNWMLQKRMYSEGYAKKKIDDLKTVCGDAEINGLEVNHQLRKVKGGKTKNDHIIYLRPEELKQIEETNLESEALKNARKWLLLGCNLGQRGQDLLNLTEKNFVTRNGLDLIELKQQKTGKQVTIPVLRTTKEILKDGLPHKISLQKFNDQLKDLCKEAKLEEEIYAGKVTMVNEKGEEIEKDSKGRYLEKGEKRKIWGMFPKHQVVSSHVCRRSFATNTYGKLPTPLIMQITAHSTEKMFLGYIGKSSMDYAQQIADFYNNAEKKNIDE